MEDDEHLIAVVSTSPEESCWYTAYIAEIDIDTGTAQKVYCPRLQIGCPVVSSSGTRVAVIEGPCSDRGVVPGQPIFIETESSTLGTWKAPIWPGLMKAIFWRHMASGTYRQIWQLDMRLISEIDSEAFPTSHTHSLSQ
jgi:hypothetical protein